jgi:hypothetical protein
MKYTNVQSKEQAVAQGERGASGAELVVVGPPPPALSADDPPEHTRLVGPEAAHQPDRPLNADVRLLSPCTGNRGTQRTRTHTPSHTHTHTHTRARIGCVWWWSLMMYNRGRCAGRTVNPGLGARTEMNEACSTESAAFLRAGGVALLVGGPAAL